ncbi:hypothetical protein [Brevundimonas alba]|nr:hypothetical protein [Brevundimonas alba]
MEGIGGTGGEGRLAGRPYCRRSQEEWAEIRALYRAGATAKSLAERFGGTERTLYTHVSKHGCLRKDQPVVACALDEGAVHEAVRAGRGCAADAPVRALAEGASLGEAARAAAETAILMLREAQPARSYTYARLAGQLERLARGSAGTDGSDPDGTERGRQAALDFLRREALA